jgi:hypothetical protein
MTGVLAYGSTWELTGRGPPADGTEEVGRQDVRVMLTPVREASRHHSEHTFALVKPLAEEI